MKKVTTAIVFILAAWSVFEIVLYASRPAEPKVVLTVPEKDEQALAVDEKDVVLAPSVEQPIQTKEASTQPNLQTPQEPQSVRVSPEPSSIGTPSEPQPVPSEAMTAEPDLIYPKTTQELAQLFDSFNRQSVPRIYVGAFPEDFKENGTPALFAKTLLPLILAENEKIATERRKLLPIVVKIRRAETLTPAESQFFDFLTTKYDVVEPGQLSAAKELLQRVDRVSPALAITQALEATQGGKDLTSIFGIRKWNDAEEFVPATYPDLRQTVADYALHLNTTVPYYVFWELRSLNRDKRQPMKARVFMDGLTSYRYGDRSYVQKLMDVYEKYGLSNLDDTQLEKEKEE